MNNPSKYYFNGIEYGTLQEQQHARRQQYVEYVKMGYSFKKAAESVGVSQKTASVWMHGKSRGQGRPDEEPCHEWVKYQEELNNR